MRIIQCFAWLGHGVAVHCVKAEDGDQISWSIGFRQIVTQLKQAYPSIQKWFNKCHSSKGGIHSPATPPAPPQQNLTAYIQQLRSSGGLHGTPSILKISSSLSLAIHVPLANFTLPGPRNVSLNNPR